MSWIEGAIQRARQVSQGRGARQSRPPDRFGNRTATAWYTDPFTGLPTSLSTVSVGFDPASRIGNYATVAVRSGSTVTFDFDPDRVRQMRESFALVESCQQIHGRYCTCLDCREESWRRVMAERQALRDLQEASEAEERAEALLLSCLTPAQREEYANGYCFTVQSLSGRNYRVTSGRNYNVRLLENGEPALELCALPDGELPVPDVMLAQKLMLETAEEEFLRVANKRSVGGWVTAPRPAFTANSASTITGCYWDGRSWRNFHE